MLIAILKLNSNQKTITVPNQKISNKLENSFTGLAGMKLNAISRYSIDPYHFEASGVFNDQTASLVIKPGFVVMDGEDCQEIVHDCVR